MPDNKNPQDTTPTFLRKLPDGKTEQADANGKPVKAQASTQASPKPAQPTEDDRTVAELTDALKAKGVAIPSGAKRDDLVKLAADNGA